MQEPTDKDQSESTLEEVKHEMARRSAFERIRRERDKQDRELESSRARMREEQRAKERNFQTELEQREALFVEREKKLMARQSEYEHLTMRRQAEVEALRNRLAVEVVEREARLEQTRLELEQEKERYNQDSRKRLEHTSKHYVSEALSSLDKNERQYHRLSKIWSVVGAAALIAGLTFFAYVTLSTLIVLPSPLSWAFLTFSLAKGVISVLLLGALSRYSFLFSNMYMRETLKNADRRHAINFGKFYLESYGAAADWAQVKEAFEHWNIAGPAALTQNFEPTFDIQSAEKAASLIERMAKSLPINKTS